MKHKTLPLLFSLLTLAMAPQAFAAMKIDSVVASPSPAKAGQPVKITVDVDEVDVGAVCGLTIHYDDGSSEYPQQVGGPSPNFPRSFEHIFAKPGTYRIKAEGQRAKTSLGCVGDKTISLVVEPAAAAAPKAKAGACPEGWALKGKVAKDGGFSCSAKAKGAKKPEKAIDCPAGTSYFTQGGKLGCEKVN